MTRQTIALILCALALLLCGCPPNDHGPRSGAELGISWLAGGGSWPTTLAT